MIMAKITKLIQVLTVNHKEQMEEQARHHQEQMGEQARQSREQEKKHAEQIAVLIDQVKVMDAEMKHLMEAARDGAKANPIPVGSFQPFDTSSELQVDYLEDSGLSKKLTPFPRRRKLKCFLPT